MEKLTAREELQLCYELAFFPPRLNRLWKDIKTGNAETNELKPLLDKAFMLHLRLPDSGYSSQRALQRLAVYQANSRAYGMPTFLKNIRRKINCEPLLEDSVPPHMVRDIGLPEFRR